MEFKSSIESKKRYEDHKIIHKEFNVSYNVYLKLKPKKITLRLAGCARLGPRFYGTFHVLTRIGSLAY